MILLMWPLVDDIWAALERACNIQLGVGIGTTAMVEILKFVRPETVFDPESIRVLASAFDEVWSRIEQSESHLAQPAYSWAMREVIAKRIIKIAQQGVKDQQMLVDDAVQFLAVPQGCSLLAEFFNSHVVVTCDHASAVSQIGTGSEG
jgi:hypothetical protein